MPTLLSLKLTTATNFAAIFSGLETSVGKLEQFSNYVLKNIVILVNVRDIKNEDSVHFILGIKNDNKN